MAITKHNEVNELMTLAFGDYWIESGLTADADRLKTVVSYSRAQADGWLRIREILDAKNLTLDVDPKEWRSALDHIAKLLGEMISVALKLEECAAFGLAAPHLHSAIREGRKEEQDA